MYPQVFSAAKEVDQAFLIIFGFAVFILVAVTVAMLFFLWRYHYRRNPEATDIKGNVWLEIIWTGLPTLIVLGLFWTGWTSFQAMRTIPDGAMVVKVEGRMWSWRFTYDNGKASPELVIPVDTPVKLELAARDVIHSFYVPAMRVKWDMVPGMEADAWIQSDKLGEFDIFCAEYCGLKHADMLSILRVVEQEEFEKWLADSGEIGGEGGLALMEEFGCFDCHSMDLSEDVAPSLLNIGGKERVVVLPDGSEKTVVADAEYIKRSVEEPGSELVKGWDDDMPPYAGDFTEEQLDTVAAYLLGGRKAHPGEALADEEGCLGCHTTNGEDDFGPTFLGLYGSKRRVVDVQGNETTVTADEDFLRQSIVDPSALIADGFDDGMPIYDELDEETLEGIIQYLMSLGAAEDAAEGDQ